MRIASLLSASSVDPQHSRSSSRGSDRYLVLIMVAIHQLWRPRDDDDLERERDDGECNMSIRTARFTIILTQAFR